MDHVLLNWKTSAVGLAAIFGALADIFHSLSTGSVPNIPADWAALSAGFIGLIAKDSNVTGVAK